MRTYFNLQEQLADIHNLVIKDVEENLIINLLKLLEDKYYFMRNEFRNSLIN